MSNDIHQGGCACGAVRYQTLGEPVRAAVCHCRYCQTRTGSAFGVSVYFPSDTVRCLSGTLTDYTFQTESGRRFTTRFCPVCGTSVFWTLGLFDGLIGVAGGTFDPPTFWFDVSREMFARSRAPFVHVDVTSSSETFSAHAPVTLDKAALRGG